MIELDTHKTAVVFRKWNQKNGSGIIALFPELPSDTYGYYVLSYEHIGQHGGADYQGVISRTVPATPEESSDLVKELESLGYNLAICKRQTAKIREKCHGRRRART
jgi:hypothetical protein